MNESGEATRERVAAILAADAVGYSRLMADDEPATVATLDRARDVFHSHVEANQGRVVDTAGDSVLAVFETTTGAVRASIAIQEGLADLNADTPEDRRMLFRIGIHLGDIIEKTTDGTIYGDGVNVAARLEALSEPGGITVSDSVHGSIRERLDVGFELLGEHRGKNLKSPVVAYRLLPDGGTITPTAKSKRWLVPGLAAAAILALGVYAWLQQSPSVETASVDRMAFPLPAEPSIAVLPFDNLSGDPAHDFIADGLSENIIATLAQARGMLVIARNSTFTYKGKAVKVQQVAEELGVQYVLEGSVQIAGENIRVTAQLVDALSGQHIIAERYDEPLADLFGVQDQITLEIVKTLQVELTEGGAGSMWRGGTRNIDAWRDFQRGIALAWKFTPQDNRQAQDHLRRALDQDPNYARAWTLLGWTESWNARFYGVEPVDDLLAHAQELAERAIAIDPETGEAHALLAMIAHLRGEPDQFASHVSKALEVAPNDSNVAVAISSMQHYSGAYETAQPILDRVERMTPLPAVPLLLNIAFNRNALGDYDIAETYARQADAMLGGGRNLGSEELLHALAGQGKVEEARVLAETMIAADPTFSVEKFRAYKIRCCRISDDLVERYVTAFRQAGVPERAPGAEAERPVIAVLPFESLSGGDDHTFLADGIVEDIITRLARFPDIGVIARNSSFQYKGRNVDVRTVAEELGASYVLEGSVRRSEGALRVSAQLLDARDGTHVWAETYDRDLTAGDIFAVQDDITARVVGAIASWDGTISLAANAALASKPPAALSSYECILQASAYGRAITPDNHLRVRTCLERVVREEPELIRAWTGLCWVTVHEFSMGYNLQTERAPPLERAQDYCQRAVELDPKDGWAYFNLARVAFFRGNLPAFRSAANRALELGPNDAALLAQGGVYFAVSGEWDRGLALIDRAIELNPHHQPWYHFPAFYDAYRQGDDAAALEAALKINLPGFFRLHVNTAAVYGQLGMSKEASEAVARSLELKPDLTVDLELERLRRWNFEESLIERLADGLRKAGMPEATD